MVPKHAVDFRPGRTGRRDGVVCTCMVRCHYQGMAGQGHWCMGGQISLGSAAILIWPQGRLYMLLVAGGGLVHVPYLCTPHSCKPYMHSMHSSPAHVPALTYRFIILRRASRPAVLQNIIDMRKRLKGAPTSGVVSIVMTDIEDFTGAADRW